MTSDNIWSRVRRKPFKAFRLNTSDGKHYDILHPEMILLSKNSLTIAVYDKGDKPGETLPSREVFVSPLHVASLEDLPQRKATPA
jgi:hypothetical protein